MKTFDEIYRRAVAHRGEAPLEESLPKPKPPGALAKFIANRPNTDVVGLLDVLKRRGGRLGGNTGPMCLRMMGRDTSMFPPDVAKTLIESGVIDKPLAGEKARAAVQAAFSAWPQQSGRPLCRISRILAASQG